MCERFSFYFKVPLGERRAVAETVLEALVKGSNPVVGEVAWGSVTFPDSVLRSLRNSSLV